jgi:CHAT domain-containing protein
MNKIKLLFLVIFFPCLVYSQQWQQYSDSVLVYFKKNDVEKASHFIKLADIDLEKLNIVKDTIYADYLYRKGGVLSDQGYYDSSLLKQSLDNLKLSLDIWESSTKKNYLKIMKINYFLGANYFSIGNQSQNKVDYDTSYKYYEKCYFLIKKYKFQNKSDFKGVLNALSFIDDSTNKDFKKAKQFAQEYIDFIKETSVEDFNFNFNYVNILRINEDFFGQEKVLLEYLTKYETQKLNNPELLFQIYFQLFVNKEEQKNGDYPKYPNEVIKYGEKAIEICISNNLQANLELSTIYLQLEIAYGQIKDNINTGKYRKLNYEYFSKNNELDYWDELKKLYYENDYVNFKIKFDEFESKFKKEKRLSDLLEIYKYSLTLFERSILFSKGDIDKQIEFISNNINSLTAEDKLIFDMLLIEFNMVTNRFEKALEICNNNLDIKNPKSRIKIYNYKVACEDALGFKELAIKTGTKNLELAISIYGDEDPRLLPLLNSILDMDPMGTNPNSIKVETKALRILYQNKLEQTVTAVSVWNNLGNAAMNRKNDRDALIYYQKSIAIIENTKTINNPNIYLFSLYGIANVYISQSKFDRAKEYLDKIKKYLDENSNIMTILYEGYYYSLGNYYFQQDDFLAAKVNYEKSFTYYDSKKNSSKKIRYYFCSYFLENNGDEFIENIKTYQKENNDTYWGWGIIYLLKYNSGDFIGAKNLLEMQLNKLISDNNKYFNLLSDNEKENLYKSFVIQFEFLNSFLTETDSEFLETYIQYRFYSKSLLFSNHFKSDEKNRELFSEFKSNISIINKAVESKSEDFKTIENLKNKNREIEKFLSENIKPLIVPTLKDLKNKLTIKDAYVEIIRINKQSKNSIKKAADIIKFFTDSIYYGAIVIKKNSKPKFILIDGSNQLEKQYASSFKSKIQTKQEDLESYNLLFEKIDNELKDVKKIYLVTDGVYNSINIESIYNPNRKQYLIDYLKIQPIQNVRAITDDKKDFKVGMNTKTILFGNPDFDLLITDAKIDNFTLDRGLDNTAIDEIKSSVKIGRLNGTQKEIESLDAILKNSESTVELFSKANATEDNLKKIQSPGILHIATHGYFLSNDDTSKTKQSIANLINDNYKNDSYLKSGLLFAGAQNTLNGNQLENSNNGILTAEEAKSLNLKNTELVVLSACETGLGDHLVGEGVIGLQRAFMIAGAKSVIMSLWSVSDEKTQELMTLFYTNWIKKGISKEDALYQAKIEMKRLYPQPYYWAGFVLLE